ncbi:MAG: fumarate hydratase [Candidatus Omnitrophica bacterium]|nr:fumarate hydratase [Candidatus Omnitrophota bacterium]
MKNLKLIQEKVRQATATASFQLPKDVAELLKRGYRLAKDKRARLALGWIIENAKIARKEKLALCQDTGLPVIFIEAGRDIRLSFDLIDTIKRTVENSYKGNYLRNSLVDPLSRVKPGYQGAVTHLEFNSKIKGLRVTLFPKGFGSENKTKLKMFNPTVRIRDIENFIIDSVLDAGPEACPPFILGIGIGGTSDYALLLAKKALLEDITKPNKDTSLARLERRLLKRINSLNIGPMGFGGNATALAVKIRKSPTHIAGLPIAVNISCWALRRATVEFKS